MSIQNVQTLDRTLDIIELLAISAQGMGVTEIGQKLGLHKSTVHRLINALVHRGYIEKDQKSGLYKIGLKFIEISSLHLHQLELKTEAAPIMRHLAEMTGQVTHLAILDKTEVVYRKVDVIQSLRLYSRIGKRLPCIARLWAKSYCQARDKSVIYSQGINFEPILKNTITDQETFLSELEKQNKRLGSWTMRSMKVESDAGSSDKGFYQQGHSCS